MFWLELDAVLDMSSLMVPSGHSLKQWLDVSEELRQFLDPNSVCNTANHYQILNHPLLHSENIKVMQKTSEAKLSRKEEEETGKGATGKERIQ